MTPELTLNKLNFVMVILVVCGNEITFSMTVSALGHNSCIVWPVKMKP